MKPRLVDRASDTYSQFGEDGMLDHILGRIGPGGRVAVEFGAGDGLECANTARLWHNQGWRAVLVEPDPARYEALEGNAGPFDTLCRRQFITPAGTDSIGAVLSVNNVEAVDVMSIDVDGDDYFILAALDVRPRVIVIEFNPTVPPHIEMRQDFPGSTFGASLLAIIRLAQAKGYRFVGATHCNAFLVAEAEAGPFDGYETDPGVLFPPGHFTYAVTDFAGRVTLAGQILPWGATAPYVLPLVASTYVSPPTDSAQQIRRGFETEFGPALWLSPNGLSLGVLQVHLTAQRPLICIDLTHYDVGSEDWIVEVAEQAGYRALLVGRVLGLVHHPGITTPA